MKLEVVGQVDESSDVPKCEIGSGEESGDELEEPRCEIGRGGESGMVIGCEIGSVVKLTG